MSDLRDLWYDWLGANTWLFKQINSLSDVPIYSSIMKVVSALGSERLMPYYFGAIVTYFVLSLIHRLATRKGGVRYYIIMWLNIFLVLGAGMMAEKYSVDYLKRHFAYPRPYVALAGKVIQLEGQYVEEANQSFPSRHVAIITLVVIALWPALTENLRWAGIGAIIAMSWSRMAVGVHFPMDVISAFFIIFVEMMLIRYVIYGITTRIFLR